MNLTVPPRGHSSIIEKPERTAGSQLIGQPFGVGILVGLSLFKMASHVLRLTAGW
jgi:hypothetical protein